MPAARRCVASIAAALALFSAGSGASLRAAEFSAGGYSFSDELGGFRLLSAAGSGTPDDPIVVKEEFVDVAPVTLVIRNHQFLWKRGGIGQSQLTLVKQVKNASNRIWAGFEIELQEARGEPSDYGDGLSFKQFAVEAPDVASDVFMQNERLFEPADRIEFRNGHVDPDASVMFRVTITDPTPAAEFYLVQDPKLLSSSLPSGKSFAAR